MCRNRALVRASLESATVFVLLRRHAERACYIHSMQAGHLPEWRSGPLRLSTVYSIAAVTETRAQFLSDAADDRFLVLVLRVEVRDQGLGRQHQAGDAGRVRAGPSSRPSSGR